MYFYNFALAVVTTLIGWTKVNAAIPHIRNLTSRTTGAILLPPSTYEIAVQRCELLNEKLWSQSSSSFHLGLDNALRYTAFVNGNNGSISYWVSSSNGSTFCNAITTDGILIHKPCQAVGPGLCTNSGPILSASESDTRPELQITVQCRQQNITGFRDFYGFQFRGIRFAPNVERFALSTLYEGSGPVDATKYGPGCLQSPDPRWPTLSEDCYFLNVWTPYLSADAPESARRKKLKAVMVWLYGGGNTGGTGTDPEKEGGNLASRGDVVVVTFNYRLGNLGFLPFKDGIHNGNYAISDMLTALRWVNKNIENFGGDPRRVTIWGESAGATNVRTLLAVPEAEALIAGAIMQSMPGELGSQSAYTKWEKPKDVYESITKKVLRESMCDRTTDEVSCLKSYDALRWWTESGRTVAIGPTQDGKLIPYRALPLSGPLAHPHKIPIMLGYNRDETAYQFSQPTNNFSLNLQRISAFVGISFAHLANSSFAPERSPSWPTYTDEEKVAAVFNATSKVAAKGLFTCLTNAFSFSAAKNNVFSRVYEFQFNRTYQPARFTDFARTVCGRDVHNPEQEEYYKCHAGEVPFTFGNVLQQGWRDRDGIDTPFARLIVDYWSAFARTGTMEVEEGFFNARGFVESYRKMKEAGVWSGDAKNVMRLQWGGLGLIPIDADKVGCAELGFAEDFYESYDYIGDKYDGKI
ncbi:Carboxylesterase family-domain-containing protein [Phaeosphaeriaceae sp. PMI808]|nr:Carboxylesterase family-domain-containing protein [Phaeosphaeriaceae sp. PMI808]